MRMLCAYTFHMSRPGVYLSNSYTTRHKMVVRQRGRARDLLCEHCGKQARQWATLHELDGTDPSHYIPLCYPCHAIYDGKTGVARPDWVRAKISAANTGNPKVTGGWDTRRARYGPSGRKPMSGN